MEVLEAVLQLNIDAFTASLQTAAQQVQAFAQAITGSVGASAQAFQQQVQQINHIAEATRKATQTVRDARKAEIVEAIALQKERSAAEAEEIKASVALYKYQEGVKQQLFRETLAVEVRNRQEMRTSEEASLKAMTALQRDFFTTTIGLSKERLAAETSLQKDFFAVTQGMHKERVAQEIASSKALESLQKNFLSVSIGMEKERRMAIDAEVKAGVASYKYAEEAKQQLFRESNAMYARQEQERQAANAASLKAMQALQKDFFAVANGLAQQAAKEEQTLQASVSNFKQELLTRYTAFKKRIAQEDAEIEKRAAAQTIATYKTMNAELFALQEEAQRRTETRRRAQAAISNAQGEQGIRSVLGQNIVPQQELFLLQGYIRLLEQATPAASMFENAIARIGTSLRTLGGYFAASIIISIPFKLIEWGKEAAQTAIKMESLNASFAGIAKGAAAGANALEFVRSVARRVGLDLLSTADSFKNLMAASQGTVLEGDRIRKIFEQMSIAGRVLGLDAGQMQRALLALEQMISKGCHGRGTLIRMADGSSKPVEDITRGESLMGPDHEPRVVLLLASGVELLCTVAPVSGEAFVVNIHHLLRVWDAETGQKRTIMVQDYLKAAPEEQARYALLCDGAPPIDFTIERADEGEFFGFLLSGDHLYLDANGIEHHNTVSSEELRKQLGNAIPGALNIMARALGVTTAELNDMMKAGDLISTEVLPKFLDQVEREFGPGLEKAANTAAATFARFGNNVRDVAVSVGDSILTLLKPVLDTINKGFELWQRAKREAEDAKNQGVGEAPARMAAIPGAPDLNKRLENMRQLLEENQEVLRVMNQSKGTIFEIPEKQIADQEDIVRRYAAAWKRMLQEHQNFLDAQADTGGADGPGEAPFARQTKEVTAELKNLDEQISRIAMQRKHFSSMFTGNEAELSMARDKLREIEGAIEKVSEAIGKAKALRDIGLTTQLQKDAANLNAQHAAAQADVDRLEAAKEAAKEAERENERLEKKKLADAERMARERIALEDKMRVEIAKFEDDTSGKILETLTQTLSDAKRLYTDQTLTAKYESVKRMEAAQAEAKAIIEAHDRESAELRDLDKEQEDLQNEIAGLRAKGTKTALDNFDAMFEKTKQKWQDALDHGRISEAQMEDLLAAGSEARSEIIRKENEKAKKETEKTWREIANTIENTLASAFYDIFKGTKNTFEAIRDSFLKLLAKMAADAIAQQIIIPVLISMSSSGGSGGGGGGLLGTLSAMAGIGPSPTAGGEGGGGGSGLNQAITLVGGANTISGALGGPSAGSLLGSGGSGGMGALLNVPIDQLLGGLAGTESGLIGVGAATIGQVAAPIGLGVAVTQILLMLNQLIGLQGATSSALAGLGGGAAAGALAGSTIFPGIGTAVGAVGGALLGAFSAGLMAMGNDAKAQVVEITRGLRTLGMSQILSNTGGQILQGILTAGTGTLFEQIFGPGRPEPGFEPRAVEPGHVRYSDELGLIAEQDFRILSDFHQRLGVDYETFIDVVNDSMNALFNDVIQGFKGSSPDVQRALVAPLNAAFDNVAAQIQNYPRIGGKDMQKQLEQMLTKDFPEIFAGAANGVIEQFMEAVAKIDPVIQAFNDIIDSLAADIKQLMEAQLQLHLKLEGNIKTLYESLMTPAEILLQRKAELSNLMKQFEEGNEATRITLAPQIGDLSVAIMELSKQVFSPQTSYGDITGIQGAIKQLQESLYTPAQTMVARQNELNNLMEQFRTGTSAIRAGLSPQITQLALQIMELAKGVNTLAEQQALLADFPAQLRVISEALFSPAQTYLSQRAQLNELLMTFRGGTPEQQLALEPQIAQLAAQIIGLARGEEVLGQDPQLLRQTQSELLAIMKEVQDTIAAQTHGQTSDAAQLQATLERTQAEMVNVLREVEYTMAGSIVNAGAQTIQALWETAGAIVNTTYTMSSGMINAQYQTANGVVTAQYNSAGQLISTENYVGGVLYGSINNTSNTVAVWSQHLYNIQAALIGQVAYSRDLAWVASSNLQNALWVEVGLAQEQIRLLVGSLQHLETVDAVVQAALGVLGQMNNRLHNPLRIDQQGTIGEQLQRDSLQAAQALYSLQGRTNAVLIGQLAVLAGVGYGPAFQYGRDVTGFQHGGYVPRDMTAMLHRGERIVPEWEARDNGGAKTISINVYGGNKDVTQIADAVLTAIERKAGRLHGSTLQVARR